MPLLHPTAINPSKLTHILPPTPITELCLINFLTLVPHQHNGLFPFHSPCLFNDKWNETFQVRNKHLVKELSSVSWKNKWAHKTFYLCIVRKLFCSSALLSNFNWTKIKLLFFASQRRFTIIIYGYLCIMQVGRENKIIQLSTAAKQHESGQGAISKGFERFLSVTTKKTYCSLAKKIHKQCVIKNTNSF